MSILPSNSFFPQEEKKVPRVLLQGGMVKGSYPGNPKQRRGVRGKIRGFTEAARRRLMMFFAVIDWEQVLEHRWGILFLTLTVGPEVSGDYVFYVAKRRFEDWLEYHTKARVRAIWRRELQPDSGLNHYHICLIGPHYISADKIRRAWMRATGMTRKPQVRIEKVECVSHVERYLGKYVSKAAYEGKERPEVAGVVPAGCDVGALSLTEAHNGEKGRWGHTGTRWWYVSGRRWIPVCRESAIEGAEAVAVMRRVRRVFRKWRRRRDYESRKRSLQKTCGGKVVEKLEGGLRRMSHNAGRFLSRPRESFTFFGSREVVRDCVSLSQGEYQGCSIQIVNYDAQRYVFRLDSVAYDCVGIEHGLRRLSNIERAMSHAG